MPYLLAAALLLTLGVATIWLIYRGDAQGRRDRDYDRSRTRP